MAGSLNKVSLLGNVGKDPELRSVGSGDRVANFSIATTESWTDKATQEKRERTEWHKVVCWNQGLCQVIERYVSKGSKVFVEGKLQTRKWQDQSGQDRYSTEVVLDRFGSTLILLGDAKREAGHGDRNSGGYDDHRSSSPPGGRPGSMSDHWQPPASNGGGYGAPRGGDLDDEIPF